MRSLVVIPQTRITSFSKGADSDKTTLAWKKLERKEDLWRTCQVSLNVCMGRKVARKGR